MKKSLKLGLAFVMMLVSLAGCYWGYEGRDGYGRGGGYDRGGGYERGGDRGGDRSGGHEERR